MEKAFLPPNPHLSKTLKRGVYFLSQHLRPSPSRHPERALANRTFSSIDEKSARRKPRRDLDPRFLLELGKFEMITAEDIALLNETKNFIKKHKNI